MLATEGSEEAPEQPNGHDDKALLTNGLVNRINYLKQLLTSMCETKEPDVCEGSQSCDFNLSTYNITNNMYNTDRSMKSRTQIDSEEKLATYKKYITTCYSILTELKKSDVKVLCQNESILDTDLVGDFDIIKINRLNDTYRQQHSNKRNSHKNGNVAAMSIDDINLSTMNEGVHVVLPQSPVKSVSKPSNTNLKNLIFSMNKLFLRSENNTISEVNNEEDYVAILKGVNIRYNKK
jgi:hypothetical protein